MSYQLFAQSLKDAVHRAERRKAVLLGVVRGQTDEEIAIEMDIHPGTVRKQLSNIYEALGLSHPFEGDRSRKRPELLDLIRQYERELLRDPELRDIALALPKETDETAIGPKTTLLNGIVPLGDPRYVRRSPDEILEREFAAHADESRLFARIKGVRRTGKSSLLTHLRAFLENHLGHTVGFVDLGGKDFGIEVFENLGKLLYCFTYAVTREFKNELAEPPLDLRDYWRDDLAPGLPCTDYLNDYVFSRLKSPKTLLIDGIDAVLGREPVQTQFLELLRSWNEEKMKRVSQDPIVWPHIAIAYSTEPYAQYKLQGSPLDNVGLPLQLPEFTESQVAKLANQYGLALESGSIKSLMNWVGGHPALMNLAFNKLANDNIEVGIFLAKADRSDSPFRSYLLQYLQLLENHPSLSQCLQKILEKEECDDEFAKFQLEQAGLIQINEDRASVIPLLYQAYFSKYFEDFEKNGSRDPRTNELLSRN